MTSNIDRIPVEICDDALTDARLVALRDEAVETDDSRLERLCTVAISGQRAPSAAARREIAKIIADAKARRWSADVYEGRADMCGGYYEDALVLAQAGDLIGALEPLETARRIEAEAGDDSHARGAIAVVRSQAVDDATVQALHDEAAQAGDLECCAICTRALEGDTEARVAVAHMIQDALGAMS